MLDIRDWRPDLGEFGKLHVRHGKGSRGRGPKPRLVPAINGANQLIDWWLAEVRPQYGHDLVNPDAPLLPSERLDREPGPVPPCRRERAAPHLGDPGRPVAPGLVGAHDATRAAALLRVLAVRRRGAVAQVVLGLVVADQAAHDLVGMDLDPGSR
jgi:hypothetical protein